MRRWRLPLVLTLVTVASSMVAGCKKKGVGPGADEFDNVGYGDASTEPPAGVEHSVAAGDLDAAAARGQLLWSMQRALALAWDEGRKRGNTTDGIVFPLVEIDPGGRSAQVIFMKMPPEATDPEGATATLLVTMQLSPDSVLEVRAHQGTVKKFDATWHRLHALLAADQKAKELAGSRVFHLLDVVEAAGDAMVRRVYAVATDDDGADVEVVVGPAKKRKKPPVVRDAAVRKRPEAGTAWRIDVPQPGPLTVLRVVETGPDAPVVITGADGSRWTVAPTGQVRRTGP